MKAIKRLAWTGLAIMSSAIIYGFLYGDYMMDGPVLMGLVWGRVTMIDTYVSYAIFIAWILYRETSSIWKLTWTLLVLVLGSYALCLYVLITSYRCYNSPRIFFMGKSRRA